MTRRSFGSFAKKIWRKMLMKENTLPFFKVRSSERQQILINLRTYTGNDPSKVTSELAKTAIKAVVDRGTSVVGVPRVEKLRLGDGLYIPLRNQPLEAFTTVAQLQGMM